jgi:hypothetical protein
VVKRVKSISLLNRPVKVLVTGAEGAGKTKLTLVWDSSARATSPKTTRSPAAEDHDLRITADRTRWWRRRPRKYVTMMVAPGQIANESRKAVFDTYTVPGRRPDGVIHVVCWGFNTPWRGKDAADVRAAIARTQEDAARAQQARRAFEDASARAAALPAQDRPRHARDATTVLRRDHRGRVRGQVRRSVRHRFSACTRRDQPVQRVDVVARLREINLMKELDDFETVSRFLVRAWAQRGRSGEQFWLVIALAKCDLYETAAARRYYDPDSADEPTEFSRIVADLRADIPTLNVVVCPVSSGPEPYGGKLNLGVQVEPRLGRDESSILLNRFWAVVEDLCGIT